MKNYIHRFELKPGKWIFVQDELYSALASDYITWCYSKWHPASFMFHLKRSGHVGAMQAHLGNAYFLKFYLENYFFNCTLAKIIRSLKRIGFRYDLALKIAQESTVADKGRYFLPFGFCQSPLLASICLDKSEIGSCIRRLRKEGVRVSVFVDDIILSSDSNTDLLKAEEDFIQAANMSGFPINTGKSSGVGRTVTVFNIHFDGVVSLLTPERILEFASQLDGNKNPHSVRSILRYVELINRAQAAALAV
jgi:hypothetical protein